MDRQRDRKTDGRSVMPCLIKCALLGKSFAIENRRVFQDISLAFWRNQKAEKQTETQNKNKLHESVPKILRQVQTDGTRQLWLVISR